MAVKISKERLGPRCRQRTKSTVGLEERVKRFPFQQFVSELPVVAAEKVWAAGEKTPCGVPRRGFAATSRPNRFGGLPPGITRNSWSGKTVAEVTIGRTIPWLGILGEAVWSLHWL